MDTNEVNTQFIKKRTMARDRKWRPNIPAQAHVSYLSRIIGHNLINCDAHDKETGGSRNIIILK